MDVFDLRRKLIDDYAEYATSFVTIADDRIREHIDRELKEGLLWPEPLIQLNPSFESGGYIDELVDRGLLHQECQRIFRIKREPHDPGEPLRLHRHQLDAIEAARKGVNYMLMTGTGSGKSLTYLVPIVDAVLRRGAGRGIQAIVVYPMNALANSQCLELEKFLKHGYPDGRGPVRFARYTGQENDEERQAILADPPDIILTNYVMLELILTRPFEKGLIEAAKGLRFLVFDELHTYRGRQGADVSLLARRVRNASGSDEILYVGTSATMSTGGTLDDQRREVARVTSELFGAPVEPEHVIGETPRRVTQVPDLSDEGFVARLRERVVSGDPPADTFEAFVADPLSAWIESTLGLAKEKGTRRLVRQKPRPDWPGWRGSRTGITHRRLG